MISIPKGTKDVLPKESYKWQFIEGVARELAKTFHLKEIRTPVFEHTELFLRGVGETTDVVTKEMYTFLDKGDRSITLKPEGTAGVARSFIENGLFSEALPQKMYYIAPCFRYERPQAGRLREFHQIGVEIFGADGADTDAEVITLADLFLKKVGVNAKLHINSIGCPTCRKEYNERLKAFFAPHFNELCPDCKARYEKNPLRLLDCKEESCKAVNKDAPNILDCLCSDCSAHFEKLKEYLTLSGVEYEIDPRIVRGLDYYTRTVFEFMSPSLGAQSTVLGGGRYDKLIEDLSGPNTPAVGFGAGIERLILCKEAEGGFPPEEKPCVYFVGMDDESRKTAFSLCLTLRKHNVSAEYDHMSRSVKAQFKYADKIGAKYVAVLGESELQSQTVSVKNMETSETESVAFSSLVEFFSHT